MYFQAFRHLVRNFKRRDKFRLTKKQGHYPLTLNRKIAINKSRTTTQHFFTHLQSYKGESMCHVYPVEDRLKWLQGNVYKLPYT